MYINYISLSIKSIVLTLFCSAMASAQSKGGHQAAIFQLTENGKALAVIVTGGQEAVPVAVAVQGGIAGGCRWRRGGGGGCASGRPSG